MRLDGCSFTDGLVVLKSAIWFKTCGDTSESQFKGEGLVQLGSGVKSNCVYGSVLFVIIGYWYVLGVALDALNVSSLGSKTLCYRKCCPVLLYSLIIANSALPF